MEANEAQRILEEYNQLRFAPPPKRKSNNRLNGHKFAYIAMNHIKPILTDKYATVVGPLWIKGQEWVEWDGAIVEKDMKEIIPRYFNPDSVFALFEFKAGGIYGRKKYAKGKGKTLKKVIADIKNNFRKAQKCCNKNLCGSYYIALHDRQPKIPKSKRKRPIDYYKWTKTLEPEVTTCVLFNSTSLNKKSPILLDSWDIIIDDLKKKLM